jgi:phenylacetate-coenzyme A ligase PaaK-like adenylate-forming protein
MRVSLLAKVLSRHRELRRRESWTRPELLAHQQRSQAALRNFALKASPFYQRFHQGLGGAPLSELPVLTKATLMEHFDEVVTHRGIVLQDLRSFLPRMAAGELFRGKYYVSATSGTTGEAGVFLWDADEWAGVLASYSRPYAWGGVDPRLTRRTKMAVVSSTTPWHQSALVGATVDSPFIPTLRLDSGTPIDELAPLLQAFRPDVVVGYASVLGLLAAEQMAGRLAVSPQASFSSSEVLTDSTRRMIASAWGHEPFAVYAATETAGIAAECEYHSGMHLFEDTVITEVVDENYQPVVTGEYGAKVLVTVLGSRVLPLIRYEMGDSVRLSPADPCPCGRPFARLDGIQGREQEALRMARPSGGQVMVHPTVFHNVMDTVPVTAWQIIQDADGLTILVVGLATDRDPDRIARSVGEALTRIGAAQTSIHVERVDAIPRTRLGKAHLIRSAAGSLNTGNDPL